LTSPRQTPVGGVRAVSPLPGHIAGWQLPPGWKWGTEGIAGDLRHYQEVVDGLGRSLALVTAPNSAHHAWLQSEARSLAHRSHPSIPTTYHYWALQRETRRGPGYLRRWITGESVRAHLRRIGAAEIPYVMQVLRGAGSTLSYLHDSGGTHGAIRADTVWVAPTGRMWMIEWQWAVPRPDIPADLAPVGPGGIVNDRVVQTWTPPEWRERGWNPTAASDQWQLAALCFVALTGEDPPAENVPPLTLLRPECPASVASAIDRALQPDPAARFSSIAAMLRSADRGFASRAAFLIPEARGEVGTEQSFEEKIRWALGDDYELLSSLGAGSFGRVWRARDLSLEREVALKVLHPHVAADGRAVSAFWREAKLAAQLAHPGIVPIYDWDSRGDISWYTMELAEEGSVASLVARDGPRSLAEIGSAVELILEGLGAAHGIGIVHRDLKPENVLIDRYHRWRITDFGIANVTGEEVAASGGTPEFAAPEQLLGERSGPAADLFAIAGIVVFALSGNPPFGSGEPRDIAARQLAKKIDLSAYPSPLCDWIERALEPDPELRFRDALEMRDEWRAAAEQSLRRPRLAWWRRRARA
jgi:eukaryotic-like serine/threonine-protein kinase